MCWWWCLNGPRVWRVTCAPCLCPYGRFLYSTWVSLAQFGLEVKGETQPLRKETKYTNNEISYWTSCLRSFGNLNPSPTVTRSVPFLLLMWKLRKGFQYHLIAVIFIFVYFHDRGKLWWLIPCADMNDMQALYFKEIAALVSSRTWTMTWKS